MPGNAHFNAHLDGTRPLGAPGLARQLLLGPAQVQVGFDAVGKVGGWVARWGSRALVIAGNAAYRAAGDALEASLRAAEVQFSMTSYGSECCEDELRRLGKRGAEDRVQAIIGVGGGKALDAAKLVAYRLGVPVVTVPTSAATCAAWTALSNVYTPGGAWSHGVALPRNPDAVAIDYRVIASAPLRLLVSGMGDTLAKWYETSASVDPARADATTLAAYQLARHLETQIMAHGPRACEELRAGRPGSAFQAVVDVNVALAGTVGGLGGERCRSVAAHALCNAFTALPGNEASWHGEKVAFGIACQLVLQRRPVDEITTFTALCRRLGLPMSLGQLGYPDDEASLATIARLACREGSTLHHLPFPVAEADVIAALRQAQSHAVP